MTSDPGGGPWQAAARRRQAAARARKSSSALCAALPQRDRPAFLAKAAPCDRQSSARLRPSTGPVVLGKALPRTCRETSPRQSTTRRQGLAVDFIRTSFYTLLGVVRWPTTLQGCIDEILKEASVALAELEARRAWNSRLAEAKRHVPKRRQRKRPARWFSWRCQESVSPSVSRWRATRAVVLGRRRRAGAGDGKASQKLVGPFRGLATERDRPSSLAKAVPCDR